MTSKPKVVVASLCMLLALLGAVVAQAPPKEKAEIERLLKHVEGLGDAKFVRNGTEYDARTAATFLRRKWQAESANVKTAKDFIDKVGTASGTSGRPYLIRFAGGKEVPSGEYLRKVSADKKAP